MRSTVGHQEEVGKIVNLSLEIGKEIESQRGVSVRREGGGQAQRERDKKGRDNVTAEEPRTTRAWGLCKEDKI